MPAEFYDIAQIERYLTRGMDGEERSGFEALLKKDDNTRREVEAYRQLFEGFHALRSENFRQEMKSWETEWEQANTDDTELIEWYLTGELTGKARTRIENQMEEEEQFAREVAAYRQLHEGFTAARSEDFRQQVSSWEKEQAAVRRRLWPRLAAAAAILLLVGFGFRWYVQANFSTEAIVATYYQPPLEGATMGEGPLEQEAAGRSFAAANRLFQKGDYPGAYLAFDALLNQLPDVSIDNLTRSYLREQSEWSRLLSALAMDPPPFNIQEEARRIAAEDGHEFQSQAKRLLRKLQSPFYRLAN